MRGVVLKVDGADCLPAVGTADGKHVYTDPHPTFCVAAPAPRLVRAVLKAACVQRASSQLRELSVTVIDLHSVRRGSVADGGQ